MAAPWFMYPITKGYTVGHGGDHDGWDFGAPSHTPLVSLRGGVVTSHTGWYPWGGEIDTKGPDGLTETFAHADRIDVKPGQVVLPGQTVGLSGGENLPRQYSSGPHVHYSIFGGAPWDNTKSVDPSSFLSSVRGNGGIGTALGSVSASDIPGVQGIADAINNSYKAAETIIGHTVKRIGWFLLGLVLVVIGLYLFYTAISLPIRKEGLKIATKAVAP